MERETQPSSDSAETSLPAMLTEVQVMGISHLGYAILVEFPDNCSPSQHHMEQKSHSAEPSHLQNHER